MNYFFGRKEETNGYPRFKGVHTEADTLEFAIYKFVYTEDNIYKYLSDYNLSEYNYDLNRYIIKDGCYDKAEINIYVKTEEDLKYYLNDRREREKYLDMLPKIKLAYKYFKTKAFEREDYFKEHFMDN